MILAVACPGLAAGETGPASLVPADTLVTAVIVEGHTPQGGPVVSATGANDYTTTAADIADLPAGGASPLTDVLLQMPGVALDQNQQIHIRDTEGPQFQYQINGALVPLDINTNPPFLSMINPLFIRRLDLIDGILPARFSYATGGVVDIQTKDGCEQAGGGISILAGQRETVSPSAQIAGCDGRFGYYLSGLYSQSDTAFSSATPGPDAIHDHARQGQAFGVFSWALDPKTTIGLVVSASASNNQLPNVPGLTPQFSLGGATPESSTDINSWLNFRDYLAMLSLKGEITSKLEYHLTYSIHSLSQDFRPDDNGELIYQGVASAASRRDFDNTLQGDLTYHAGRHTLGAGFYAGSYRVTAQDNSLVFPVDAEGNQIGDTPLPVATSARATNVVAGAYLDDLWDVTDRLTLDAGLRWDGLTGFTHHNQLDPTVNARYALDGATTFHIGFARYMQIPSFQGIAPDTSAAFAGTTGASPAGIANPVTEDDYEWDGGLIHRFSRAVTISVDGFYERTDRYLDTGQFGVVPIFAPFNYGRGSIWGAEFAAKVRSGGLSAYANLTLGQNRQTGVTTGQFNFDAEELAYIDSHSIVLDHQPLVGVSSGVAYRRGPYEVALDTLYSSGLRGGFADTVRLPQVFQVNAAVQRSWNIPGVGKLSNRVTILNLLDRTNLIRPAEGIGIFQAAYGPRFTVLDTLSLTF